MASRQTRLHDDDSDDDDVDSSISTRGEDEALAIFTRKLSLFTRILLFFNIRDDSFNLPDIPWYPFNSVPAARRSDLSAPTQCSSISRWTLVSNPDHSAVDFS